MTILHHNTTGVSNPLWQCATRARLSRRDVEMYTSVAKMTEQQHPLARFVRDWLEERGTTQLWLAQQAGIPHSTISALLSRYLIPRPETLRKLARAMGVPVGQLLVLAGHISQEEYDSPVQQTDLARLYEVGDLSDEEWEEVREFARFVRSKRPRR